MNQHRKLIKIFRIGCLVAGLVLLLIAFLLGISLGLYAQGSIFTLFLCALFGFLLILFAQIGRKFVNLFKDVALVILNTILLFLFIEMISSLLLRIRYIDSIQVVRPELSLPYYASQNWSKSFWQEFDKFEEYQYSPWVIWRFVPYQGNYIHVDQNSIRETPGADCVPGSFKVFIFGGSTLWGWGAPDWGTIPAYLQTDLAGTMDRPVCIINFGQPAYVSTQELFDLIMQLQKGNIPDLVIYYDGVNDIYAANQSGEACVHQDVSTIAAIYNHRGDTPIEQMVGWLWKSNTFQVLKSLAHKITGTPYSTNTYTPTESDLSRLAGSVTDCYLANYKMVGDLAHDYGFEYAFFWQPAIPVGIKPLTQDEQVMSKDIDPSLVDLYHATYSMIEQSTQVNNHLFYIADVFDGQTDQVWIDIYSHVAPAGNQLIAQAILQKLVNQSMVK
jgi:hypothetical protein